ncbi:MAG: exopolyphosphatase [Geobacteraceae bacterium GWC2_55_20]|nr:MAG: exopolyphosphatase [Geobacteraceae bacterium GWC2_55_20]OGU23245.1 MAG: exopolyphosphatase [Geobacteraceae bacterium GWF2_54_21]HBA73440.1 Ppx/GppA family phosphatase [Geobacter sp.]HCE68139.1 Ppx/GppA family phosphatase [Geobacter sp.]
MKKSRLAAIDIGTNSIRCIVVEVDSQGRFMVLDDEKAAVRLGENMAASGAISPPAFARAVDAMSRIRKLIDGLKVSEVEAVATSAVRSASNGVELVGVLTRELGREIRIISGEEEADLVAISARHNFDMSGKRYMIIDIGGGSVEIMSAVANLVESCYSLQLGAVLMTDRFLLSDPVKETEIDKLRRHVRVELKNIFTDEKPIVQSFISSGGTITALASMVMSMRRQVFSSLHGFEVLRSEIVHLLAMLVRKDIKALRSVPGLNPDRADIIVAGLVVIDELMKFFSANIMLVNERGIREGLIIRCMKRLQLLPESSVQRTWKASVLEFARSCHFDEPHSRHVAKIALNIFDELAKEFKLKKTDRKLLEAAALLHDVGYFISYNSHHKHSHHLIRHADLFGFTPREREMTALIARYHRKSLPKKKHDEFARLDAKDQLMVCQLGGVLRLADGLDRRRSGLVEVVALRHDDSAYRLRLLGTEDISVEIFGGNAKKDLFEKSFAGNVVFE